MTELLTIEDLARLLHKSADSVRSDVTRNPRSLPPRCTIPGCRRILWRLQDVEKWLESFVEQPLNNPRPFKKSKKTKFIPPLKKQGRIPEPDRVRPQA